jgi:hypothetical protein
MKTRATRQKSSRLVGKFGAARRDGARVAARVGVGESVFVGVAREADRVPRAAHPWGLRDGQPTLPHPSRFALARRAHANRTTLVATAHATAHAHPVCLC